MCLDITIAKGVAAVPTKLNTTYISRALADKLAHIADHPVTTVVAPMGYGKTRALSWWADALLAERPDAVVLRQTIVTDSLSAFWRGFCRALRPWPELCREMTDLGFPADPRGQQFFLELLSDALADDGREVFYVLDDLHFLSDPALPALIAFLGGHLPPHAHIVLLSRNVIFDSATRMRLGDRLWSLGADDLRLDALGVRGYARACGQRIDQDRSEAIAESTEGWFSMVYLWLSAHAQSGTWPENSAGIYPLIDEVLLQPLPDRLRDFLVRLGLPDDFTDEAAAFLWPEGDAAALLDRLTEQNAFVTCTDGVYRYHNMLRSCARARFSALPAAEQSEALHRLGQWYERTGSFDLAAECYERCGDWDALLAAVGRDNGLSFGPERLPLIRRWTAACPEDALLRHPHAIIVFLLLLFYAREIDEMRRFHALFERSMAEGPDLPQAEREILEGEALLRMSFLSFNDISGMSAYHRRIRALAPVVRNPWTQGSPSVAMLYHSAAGALDRENEEMRTCIPIYCAVSGGHGSGSIQVMQGETDLLRGRFAEADVCRHQAEEAARSGGDHSLRTAAVFLAARLAPYLDPPQDGPALLDRLRAALRQERQYRLLTTVDLGQAWVCALQGRTEEIPDWIFEEAPGIGRVFPLIVPIYQTIVDRALLARGEWAKVAALGPQRAARCRASRFALCELYAHLHSAVAWSRLGGDDRAAEALRAALDLALPDRIVLPFAEIDLGARLTALLPDALREEIAALRAPAGTGETDPLTPREREIAVLAAQRISTAEIAAALHLSAGTVKNRLSVVYEKLGLGPEVRNKRAALAQLLGEEGP